MNKNDPILKSPLIKGNPRLIELKNIISEGRATPKEEEEFQRTLGLASRESSGEKPWRHHPEWYEADTKLSVENRLLR